MRTEGNWTGAGVVELLPLGDQEKGRNILLPKNAYDLSGSVQAVYVENHAEECVELCVGQKLGTIHSLCKQVWIQEELRGSTVCPQTFRCGLLRNNIPFSGYCGAYSHWKFMDVPEIESDEPVTLEQCMTPKKGSYNSPDGKRVQISPGETILYQYIEDGSITVHPMNTYCEGVSLPLHQGTLEDQSLVLIFHDP